jgi:NAD+ synthase
MTIRSDAIVEWLRQQLTDSGARGFVFGLSGGLDSAVLARLCQLAAPANIVGVLMPCHSDPQDDQDARLVAARFAIPTVRVDLAPAYDVVIEDLHQALAQLPSEQAVPAQPADDVRARVPAANVKPRLRMTTLYFLANALNYVVAGAANRSELSIGYFTKHGDGAVDLLPMGHLLKSGVRDLARQLGVPDEIVEKAPSAGLWPGQADEQEMGFRYAELENYLTKGPEAVAPALAMRIERLIRHSEHKRRLAPAPETAP